MSGVNDLEIAVRVRADGSGLVGQLGQDEAAVKRLASTMAEGSRSAGQYAASRKQTVSALNEEGRASAELERILGRLENRYDQAGAPMRRYSQDLLDINKLLKANAIDADHAALLQGRASKAFHETSNVQKRGVASAGELRQAYLSLGHQVQDITQGLALGVNPLVVLAQQGGHTASALAMMGGRGAGVAAFFAGPWGSAIIAAVTVVGMLTMALWDNKTAAEAAELGADGLSEAQSALGRIFDLTSGKIENQNQLLVMNARLTAMNLRAEAQAARAGAAETFGQVGERTLGQRVGADLLDLINPMYQGAIGARGRNNAAALQRLYQQTLSGEKSIVEALRETDGMDFTGSKVSKQKIQKAFVDTVSAAFKDETAKLIDQSLDTGRLAPEFRRDGRTKKERKPPKGPDLAARADRLEEFGLDTQDKLDSIIGRFSDAPSVIEQARKALAEVDDVMEDVEKRRPPNYNELIESAARAKDAVRSGLIDGLAKAFEAPKTQADKAAEAIGHLDTVISDLSDKRPPNFEALIAQAKDAKAAVQEGLLRPYDDFIQGQERQLDIAELITKGRDAEAETLRIIFDLEKQIGDLGPQRRAQILANVEALRAEQREADILRDKQQKYLSAIGASKSAIRDAIGGGLKGLEDLPGRLLDAFKGLQADIIFEKLFGDSFRRLEDQITGADSAKQSAERFAAAVDTGTGAIDRFSAALERGAASAAAAAAPGGGMNSIYSSLGQGLNVDGFDFGQGDIVVTGRRPTSPFPTDPAGFFGKMATDLAKGVGISERGANLIGQKAGQGIKGAATGAFVNDLIKPLGKMLGIKTSATGAQVGGAIGAMIPIPGGDIIGSIIGSVVGGLFKSTKTGRAVVTSAYDAASVSGNSSKFQEAANLAAESVQGGLQQIAEQLGATLGEFNVAIGMYDGDWRVNTSGGGLRKKKHGATDFDDDQAGAVAFAIMDAIRDGAIKGLSAAMHQALRSSDDPERALREALKVREIETLIGGLGSALKRTFSDFEQVAAERTRIARKYGLDLVKLEKIHAEQRAELFEQVLEARIGSMKQLLQDVKYGDLFEGDASDRRDALLKEIEKTKKEAEGGKDGAAARLADLYRQLVSTSKEAFGTAGDEYGADRGAAISGAEKIIKLENERVKAAQEAANGKLDKSNELASETNDLLAESNALLRSLEKIVGNLRLGGGRRDISTMRGARV